MIPSHLVSVLLSSTGPALLSPQQQAVLMRLMYLNVGYELTKVSDMQLFSNYLVLEMIRAVVHSKSEHSFEDKCTSSMGLVESP